MEEWMQYAKDMAKAEKELKSSNGSSSPFTERRSGAIKSRSSDMTCHGR